MQNNWFLRSKKQEDIYGPYTTEIVLMYINQGKITPEHLLSSDKTTWLEITSWRNGILQNKKKLGKYEIIGELGRGGMGIVYQAQDTELQRECALKVLLPSLAQDKKTLQRFQVEARAIAQIKHPNIIQVYEICNTPCYFFAMEYVKGQMLENCMNSLKLDEKLKIFSKICSGVAYAHKQSILHRDLKPANILIKEDKEPVIVDFGIAKSVEQDTKLTKTGEIFGTPRYIAPEIAKGQKSGKTSDVYSLGVILYEMLTGRVPFDGDNPMEILYQVTFEDPVPPSMLNKLIKRDSELEIICLKALEKDPKKRIVSAQFLKQEIESFLANKTIRLKPATKIQKIYKWVQQNRYASFMIVVTFVTLVFFGFAAYFNGQIAKENEEKATENEQKSNKNKRALLAQKCELLAQYLSPVYNKVYSEDIFQGLAQIHQTYSCLYDILEEKDKYLQENGAQDDKQEKFSEKFLQESYHRINNRLKFLILPNLPSITEHQFSHPDANVYLGDTKNVIISPQKNYIAKRLQNQQGDVFWRIWSIRNNWELLTPNSDFAIQSNKDLTSSTRYQKLVFSQNDNYISYLENNFIKIYDIKEKVVVFSYSGSQYGSFFSPKEKFFVFSASVDQKNTIIILDVKNRKIICRIVIPDLLLKVMFSKDESIVVFAIGYDLIVYDLKKNVLSYPLQKNKKNYHMNRKIFQAKTNMTFDGEKSLFIITALEVIEYNIETNALKSHPFISGADASPISINKNELIWTKSGEIIHFSKRTGSLQIFPKEKKGVINYMKYVPSDFLFYTKQNDVQIRSIFTTYPLISFQDNQKIEDIHPQIYNKGLFLATATTQSYKEFSFPFTMALFNEQEKRIIKNVTSKTVKASLTTSTNETIIENDFIISPAFFSFLLWRKNNDVWIYKKNEISLQQNVIIKISPDKKRLAFLTDHKSIKIFETVNFTVTEHDIFFSAKYNPKPYIANFTFSADSKNLLISTENAEKYNQILQYNFATKAITQIKETDITCYFMTVKDNYTLIGGYIPSKPGVLKIISPEGTDLFLHEQYKNNDKFRDEIITCVGVCDSQDLFVTGTNNGKVMLWKNLGKPQLQRTYNSIFPVKKLYLDPKAQYIAAFTEENISIFDIETGELFEIYPGQYIGEIAGFNSNWQKACFPTRDGGMIIFNQEYFLSEKAFKDKLIECDKAMEVMVSKKQSDSILPIQKLIKNIEEKLGK